MDPLGPPLRFASADHTAPGPFFLDFFRPFPVSPREAFCFPAFSSSWVMRFEWCFFQGKPQHWRTSDPAPLDPRPLMYCHFFPGSPLIIGKVVPFWRWKAPTRRDSALATRPPSRRASFFLFTPLPCRPCPITGLL